MCAGLWCLVEGDASCKTKLDPPLDGTECGADKVIPAPHCSLSPYGSSALFAGAPEEMPMEPALGRGPLVLSLYLLIRHKNHLVTIFVTSTPFVTEVDLREHFYIRRPGMARQDRPWS